MGSEMCIRDRLKPFAERALPWHGEGEQHAVSRLFRGQIHDRLGNRRRRWLGLAGRAATRRKQENGNQNIEQGNRRRGAFLKAKWRP